MFVLSDYDASKECKELTLDQWLIFVFQGNAGRFL